MDPKTEAEYEERNRRRRRDGLVMAFSVALVAAGRPPAPGLIFTDAERLADELLSRYPQASL